MKKILILSEVYYPDEIGTAYYLTKLAEYFAQFYEVRVLCGKPKYNARGLIVPQNEVLNRVKIERCQDSTLNKNIFIFRFFNVFITSFLILIKAIKIICKGDVVFVVTSPPVLPFVIKFACAVRDAKCILRVDDVYPEVFFATGIIKENGFLGKSLTLLNKILYRKVDKIIVIGRDMERLARKKLGESENRIEIITNWADSDIIFDTPKLENPLLFKLGLLNKFIVQCAGNMGRAQAIETMFKAAERLMDQKDIHFLFIGAGQKRKWMDNEVSKKKLFNITILDQLSRQDQPVFLNACDVSIVSLLKGMTGAGVPSRMYNVMAAEKPIIAVCSQDSELALIVEEEGIGWVVHPDEPYELAGVILEAKNNPEKLKEMGKRARFVVETKYSFDRILQKYHNLFESF